MICPRCKENRAHRSHRSGIVDHLARWFAVKPYRCHACNHRFYVYRDGETSPKLRTPEERRIMKLRRAIRWRRTRGEVLLYGVSSLILLALLYYVLTQHISTE